MCYCRGGEDGVEGFVVPTPSLSGGGVVPVSGVAVGEFGETPGVEGRVLGEDGTAFGSVGDTLGLAGAFGVTPGVALGSAGTALGVAVFAFGVAVVALGLLVLAFGVAVVALGVVLCGLTAGLCDVVVLGRALPRACAMAQALHSSNVLARRIDLRFMLCSSHPCLVFEMVASTGLMARRQRQMPHW